MTCTSGTQLVRVYVYYPVIGGKLQPAGAKVSRERPESGQAGELYLISRREQRAMSPIFALLVALVRGWFTFLVARQFAHLHRHTTFFWSLSLAFSSLAQ